MVVLAVGTAAASGCVERRYVINSDPPGALVLRNGQPIGAAPADDHFVYYGDYHFTLIKDGYETLQVDQHIPTPWYQFFPLDFFSEVIVPFNIENVHRYTFKMVPLQTPNPNELLGKGQVMRERGKTVTPPPGHEANKPLATPATPPAPGTDAPPRNDNSKLTSPSL